MNRQQKSGIISRTDRRPARCRTQGSGIFDKSYLLNEEKSLLSNNGHMEDPRLQTSGMTPYLITETAQGFTPALVTPTLRAAHCAGYSAGKQKGFTLIELLVVVLIIGILAAVALPQYQQAVEKARAAEALSNIASFGKAVQVWRLANPNIDARAFTVDGFAAGQLDIDVPADWVIGTNGRIASPYPNQKKCSKNFCYGVYASHVDAHRADSSTYKYEIEYQISSNSYECIAHTSADLKLCNSLSNMNQVRDDSL